MSRLPTWVHFVLCMIWTHDIYFGSTTKTAWLYWFGVVVMVIQLLIIYKGK